MKTNYLKCALLATFLFAGVMAVAADQNAAAPANPPAAESATLFPVPDYTGSLGERLRLTGDWGGARTTLAEHGFQTKLSLTQVYQGIADGGKDTRPAYGGWINLELDFDAQKMGLWPGGFLMLRMDANFEDSINPHTGALLPADTNSLFPEPGLETLTLSHVVFTQFLSEKFAVFLGKLDTTGGDMNDFAHGRGDQQFMNTAFCFNPVSAVISPYSTLGAGLILLPTPTLQIAFTAFDTKGSALTSGFDTVFNGNTTYSLEARLKTKFFGLTGHQLLGVGYSDADFTSLELASDIFIPRLGGSRPIFSSGPLKSALFLKALGDRLDLKESGSWSVYYNFDQYLLENPEDPTQGLGIFGRFGAADGGTNPIQYFYSLGFGGKGMIPGRANDRYGIGYYYMQTSGDISDGLKMGDEQGAEAYYTFAVTPWLQITPDVQIIDPARKTNDTTVVAGIRCHMMF